MACENWQCDSWISDNAFITYYLCTSTNNFRQALRSDVYTFPILFSISYIYIYKCVLYLYCPLYKRLKHIKFMKYYIITSSYRCHSGCCRRPAQKRRSFVFYPLWCVYYLLRVFSAMLFFALIRRRIFYVYADKMRLCRVGFCITLALV